MQTYSTRLAAAVRRTRTCALVGLDPRFELLPDVVVRAAEARGGDVALSATEEFCMRLIDVVAPLVPAIKPQVAFFEQLGPAGLDVLYRVMRHARQQGLLVIADAKRGDIGSTAAAYADAWLAGEDPEAARWPADALTINPYLGGDSLTPFVETAVSRGAGVYVLVRTSNPGAADFQDCETDGRPLYARVARSVQTLAWKTLDGEYGQVGAVVGATWPEELRRLRAEMPNAPLLVPGYGSQGGQAADVRAALDGQGQGALVNSSRAINFAFRRDPWKGQFAPEAWEQAVEAATEDMIRDLAIPGPEDDGRAGTQSSG